MAEGLRPHYHQEFEYRTVQYFDRERQVIVKKIQYMCMICGRVRYEKYDCYVPPPKHKTKALERNKKKYGNREWLSFFCPITVYGTKRYLMSWWDTPKTGQLNNK